MWGNREVKSGDFEVKKVNFVVKSVNFGGLEEMLK